MNLNFIVDLSFIVTGVATTLAVIFAYFKYRSKINIEQKNYLIDILSKCEFDLIYFGKNINNLFAFTAQNMINNEHFKIVLERVNKTSDLNQRKRMLVNENGKKLILLSIQSVKIRRELQFNLWSNYKISLYNILWEYPVLFHFLKKILEMVKSPLAVLIDNDKLLEEFISQKLISLNPNINFPDSYVYNEMIKYFMETLKKIQWEKTLSVIEEIHMLYVKHIHLCKPSKFKKYSKREQEISVKENLEEMDKYELKKLVYLKQKEIDPNDFKRLITKIESFYELLKTKPEP